MGQKIKTEMVKEVKRLRKIGNSYREIASILGSDVKTVYRWHMYTLRKKTVDK